MEISQRYVPEDTLVLILLRLPVKTLMQFRMVCKLWYDIITSSSFIDVHRKTVSGTNGQYLLCTHHDSYSLICKKEPPNYRKFYYKSKPNSTFGWKVYGSCEGLLCVSELLFQIDSSIYLLNPLIGKAKKLPRFLTESGFGFGDLCFGYFDDDYKVIMLGPFNRTYHVGVYSLRTDSWKVTRADSNYGNFHSTFCSRSSVCVGGVAYFVTYHRRMTCFDLQAEKIKEVTYPTYCYGNSLISIDTLGTSFSIEAIGESVALWNIWGGHLAIWILRNCGITNTPTWEKNVDIILQGSNRCYNGIGFTNNGTYVLTDYFRSGDLYMGNLATLWDLQKVQRKDITCDEEAEEGSLLTIYPLVGTLVLVNDETTESFVGTEPCRGKT
ncbi:putative F-box protein At1g19160 [Apium graveolens]|uniref:putative F-box protein At1g19160 n=1 Tax=Apium graveolens TaxID=4045 RepID=UPI003D78BC22